MPEQDRFEARLEAALRRYADEVPTTVDAAAVARRAVASGPRRGLVARRLPWAGPTLRLAWLLLLAILLSIALLAYAVLSRPSLSFRVRTDLGGTASCVETNPGIATGTGDAARVDGVAISCTLALSDARASGSEDLGVTRSATADGGTSDVGSVEVRAAGGTWTGSSWTRRYPNGLRVTEAALEGTRAHAGMGLYLRMTSLDGARWNVVGSIERRP